MPENHWLLWLLLIFTENMQPESQTHADIAPFLPDVTEITP